jgi:hypothetical protein
MELEAESIYSHHKEGEVLVLGIDRRYESYDTVADEGVTTGMVVRYAREWDGYGAMPSAVTVAPIDKFVAATGEKLRDFDQMTMTGD